MIRTLALLVMVFSTATLAQEGAAPPLTTLPTPPPPPPQVDPLPTEQPTPERSQTPRLLSAEDTTRFVYTKGRIPPGFHLVEEPKWGLVAAGSAAFAVSTAVMVLVAISSQNGIYAIPLVGQFAAFTSVASSGGFTLLFGGLGLVIDLAAQAVGAVLLILGIANPARWLERDARAPRVMLVPGAAGAPAGASLVGRF